jgi:hypothetical protein
LDGLFRATQYVPELFERSRIACWHRREHARTAFRDSPNERRFELRRDRLIEKQEKLRNAIASLDGLNGRMEDRRAIGETGVPELNVEFAE